MKKIKNKKQEFYKIYDNEIDLFELFQKIWKWKWLISGSIIIICTSTFFYLKTKPLTYTSHSNIRIGKIANVLIEQMSDVELFIRTNSYQLNNKCLFLIKTEINNNIINITYTDNSPEVSLLCLEKIINNLLNRHNLIYKKTLKKINDNITSKNLKIIITPEIFLETYTSPTSLINKPEKPTAPDSKKLPVKMAVAFFASLFLGIFLSFFIDYLVSNIKKKR